MSHIFSTPFHDLSISQWSFGPKTVCMLPADPIGLAS